MARGASPPQPSRLGPGLRRGGVKRWIGQHLFVLAAAAIVLLAAASLYSAPPALPAYRDVRTTWAPSESWLYDRHGVLIDSARVDFARRRLAWTPLAQISPVVRTTLVAAEDHRFASHGGIDWLALGASLRERLAGRPGRGASTISMQVAAYLSPDLARPGSRRWRDKLRQLRAARALEAGWSKDEILEAYLNLAGFRGEGQGIGAAALGLFGKTPASLTRDDALILAPRCCPIRRPMPAASRGAPAAWRAKGTAGASRRSPPARSARRGRCSSTRVWPRTSPAAC